MRRYKDDLHVDSDRIMLMGESAGAITSLIYAYVEEAQYEGWSGNPGFSSYANAIGSLSGEIKGEAFCLGVHPHPHLCSIHFGDDRSNNITGIN